MWFDSDFSLSKHVQNVCKSCFVQLRDFRHVRQFLTHDASVLVANALGSSRLDHCNSLFRSLSKFNLRKLQCIQNSSARIVSNTSRYTSITSVLEKLHWLPVEQTETATLVYKFLHTGFPKYFAPYTSPYSSSYSTRRSQSGGNFPVIPKFKPSVHKSVKQFGHSFAFDAPTVWNALPEEIRGSPSFVSFRKCLKTYLYTKAYPSQSYLPLAFPMVLELFSVPGSLRLVDCFLFCCALESLENRRKLLGVDWTHRNGILLPLKHIPCKLLHRKPSGISVFLSFNHIPLAPHLGNNLPCGTL